MRAAPTIVKMRVEAANRQGRAYTTSVTIRGYDELSILNLLQFSKHIYWSHRLNGWVAYCARREMYAARRRSRST